MRENRLETVRDELKTEKGDNKILIMRIRIVPSPSLHCLIQESRHLNGQWLSVSRV